MTRTTTKPKNPRKLNDAYYTNRTTAHSITEGVRQALKLEKPSLIVEPSSGHGAFVAAVRAVWGSQPRVVAIDVDAEACKPSRLAGADCFVWANWLNAPDIGRPCLIIGNPPYNESTDHVEHGLRVLRPGGYLAFLLRTGFISSKDRLSRIFCRPGLRYLWPLADRPSFTEDQKTDFHTYSVFIWQSGYTGQAGVLTPMISRG